MTGDSRIRLWQAADNYITFEYARLDPQYADAGERITDRNGLVHRVYPAVERYPVGLALSLPLAGALILAGLAIYFFVELWVNYL